MSVLHSVFNQFNIDAFVLLIAEIIAILVKGLFLYRLVKASYQSSISKKLITLLILIITSELISDAAWVIRIAKIFIWPNLNFMVGTFIIRIAWGLFYIECYCLNLFIENLIYKKNHYSLYNKLLLITATTISGYFFYHALFYSCITSNLQRPYFELIGMKFLFVFMLTCIIPPIYEAYIQIKNKKLPNILQRQLTIFLWYLIVPKVILDIISANPLSVFFPFFTPIIPQGNYIFVALTSCLTTYALYFCARKMMGLRFLNVHKHVQSPEKFNFIDDFKATLEQLSHVTNLEELKHITQNFFKEAFSIPTNQVILYIRSNSEDLELVPSDERMLYIEETLSKEKDTEFSIAKYLHEQKILITDEIEFTHFYETQSTTSPILPFLKKVESDILLPIYERTALIGYIIVTRNARAQFYSKVERDEMLVFASYLSNLIYLLQHRNLDALLQQEKHLKEELYHKHQEINQYKESIRSFLRNTRERKIGIIFYKNRQFSFGNQAAQELIGIDLHQTLGHPLTKALKQIVQDLQQFKVSQTLSTKDINGNRLILNAIKSLDDDIIITAYYPEIADVIKDKLDVIKDPSDWDYVLYLETTASGRLINTLIPGSGETLLHFKINLLKLALSKKALRISMAPQDLLSTVEIIHHISLRSTLHTISLSAPEKANEVALKLFGLNPLLSNNKPYEALLETLNEVGTIYIENIHFLSIETQQALSEYLQYGYFRVFKSDRKIRSNVRIICSSTQDLELLASRGQFSSSLLHEISAATLSMPSLLTLNSKEFFELAEGLAEQALLTDSLKPLLSLQDTDKERLIEQRPVSLAEFKELIHHVLLQKSIKKKINDDVQFDPAYTITDPQLVDIVRLGKHALKDEKCMILLWNKFKNQTKIATLLGVNRSSVNRRCKQFHLIDEHS